MSTEIHQIRGTYHERVNADFSVKRAEATLLLTRFYNGKEEGRALQLTISQEGSTGETSYIHLSKEQCDELARVLLNAFDDKIYPSD